MNTLSIDECRRDLQALDTADKLTANLSKEIERLKQIDSAQLLKKASAMLLTGRLSLEGLGLPVSLFEQIEVLNKLNEVARNKYRAVVLGNKVALEQMGEAEVIDYE